MSASPLSLTLFRHGKSDWHIEYGEEDRLRPLSQRGSCAARVMGRFLANARQVPDLAITSPAVRATRTLQLAAKAGGRTCATQVSQALYDDLDEVFGEVRAVPAGVRSLLLVGHEPTWSAIARALTGAAEIRLPTASMLRLSFEIDRWSDLNREKARIDWLVVPQLFKNQPMG